MIIIYVYSILLLTTAAAAIVCGLYAVQGNYKYMINKMFLLLTVSLSIWAFGLAVTGAAQTEHVSAIGRRTAPLGWATHSSITLHFFLMLTNKDAVLKKRWTCALLYLPSAITIAAYTILPLFGLNPDVLVHTEYGWAKASATDAWDWFFYSYTLIYVAIGFVLLIKWGRNSSSANVKMQAKILSYSMLASVLLGTATDILPSFFNILVPQISAIFMLVILLACSYCISQYNFLRPENSKERELILNREARTNVYRYMSFIVISNCLFILSRKDLFSYEPHLLPSFLAAALIFIFSLFLVVIDRLSLEDKFKEVMVSITLSFLIPFMTLWFAHYGFYTTWAFVFSLMIICLLFNRQIILSSIIVSSFITQMFQWVFIPSGSVEVSAHMYVFRLTIICTTALLSLYVNKIYLSRLKENIDHVAMQTIISEISHDFISVNDENITDKLNKTLGKCGEYMQCDCASITLINTETHEAENLISWFADSSGSDRCSYEEPIHIYSKGKTIGHMRFSAEAPLHKWEHSTQFLEIISDIISDGIVKVHRENELNHIAYHDQLTDIPNRAMFKEKLIQAINCAEKSQGMIGVVFLDLDSFKSINDTLGHDQGDRLLKELARVLSSLLRSCDMAARFGGDEFVLFIDNIHSTEELTGIMDGIMHSAQKPVILSGQEFFISISAGVAIYPQDGADPDTLLKNADSSMYKAKSSGKGRYVLCSDGMKEENLKKVRLTNLLYRAVEKNQLLLHYQPQIDLSNHCIIGIEALVRWNLDGRELIGPDVFIPLAEQTGLIHAIGEWVLYQACTNAKRWHAAGAPGLRISVNISVHQLKNPNFIQTVRNTLKKTGLDPQYLELEITESVSNDNIDNIIDILNSLKELGVSIAIDDFGTEYSSLSRLKLLPIDRIKMDMQFVQGIDRSEKDKAISKVIINLAKSLNLKVIAEGVETEPQLDFLKQRMCDEVQGYYYYRPQPAEKIDSILAKSSC